MKKIENPNPSGNNLKKELSANTVKGVNELLSAQKVATLGVGRRNRVTPDTGRPEIVAHEVIIM